MGVVRKQPKDLNENFCHGQLCDIHIYIIERYYGRWQRGLAENDDLSLEAFLNVLIALVLFFESNQDLQIPVKLIKALLQHYNLVK